MNSQSMTLFRTPVGWPGGLELLCAGRWIAGPLGAWELKYGNVPREPSLETTAERGKHLTRIRFRY